MKASFRGRLRLTLILLVLGTSLALSALASVFSWSHLQGSDSGLAVKNLLTGADALGAYAPTMKARMDVPAELAAGLLNDETVGVSIVPMKESAAPNEEPTVQWDRARVFGQPETRAVALSPECRAGMMEMGPPPDLASYFVWEPSPLTCQGRQTVQTSFWLSVNGERKGYLVTTLVDPRFAREGLRLLVKSLLLATGAATLLALAIAGPVTRIVLRPVADASRTARKISQGDLHARIAVRGRDELAGMSREFNEMADSLTGMISQQRRFVADVAHELRTPTATLLASATALEDPQHREAAAALVVPQVRRLARLTEELLEISRIDGGGVQLRLDEVDLAALVREEVATSPLAAATTVEGTPGGAVTCDAPRIALVVRNLLANAATHGAPPVRVVLGSADGAVTVSVADSGDGVPDGLRERVFDRFVQGDDSRHGEGSGLGLALARENARLHGGDLTISEDGCTFTLSLPTTPPAPGPTG